MNEMEAKKDGSKSLWTKQLKSRSTNGYNYGQWIMKNDEKGLHLPSLPMDFHTRCFKNLSACLFFPRKREIEAGFNTW
jgi:hypothetical protein